MQAAIDHFAATNLSGIRLIQAAYHNRSLCLYTRLGFQTREPLSVIQGPATASRRKLSKIDYNEVRTHLSLGKDAPCTRLIERFGDIIAQPGRMFW
jgi:hypothetical protein